MRFLLAALLCLSGLHSVGHAQMTAAAPTPLPAPRFVKPSDVDLKAILPPFPKPGTLESNADVATMLALQLRRSKAEEEDAQADSVTTMTDWTKALFGPKVTPQSHPKLFALAADLHNDMRGMNRAANEAQGFRQRPKMFDTRIKPSLDMVGHGNASYPSARTSSGYVWAGVIARIAPELKDRAESEAERIAWRRVVGGVHYPSDIAGSRFVAAAVLTYLEKSPDFAKTVSDVTEEYRRSSKR
jgi:acid phosphatase (class A)